MTAQKDLKKRIRARQAKTGESYTTARSHIIRGKESQETDQESASEQITAVVLKCNEKSMRVRILGEDGTLTLRTSSYDAMMRIAPGQLIKATLTKRWTWRDDAYASASVQRAWTDISALDLEPLPLEDQGIYHLDKIHDPFLPPDPYAEMWDFFASTPRRASEFDGIAWGAGPGGDIDDFEIDLVSDAAEIGKYDPATAREILMELLLSDIRCIDAHAHLGNLVFDHRPEDALTHYDIAIQIGELSLGQNFDGMLPWGHIYNRPFLRALQGLGLCFWRLDQPEKAREVFERILALNPADHQGMRFCWDDVRNGRPWTPDDAGEAYGTLASTIQ